MTVFYKFNGKMYANITNKCSCSCVFCIRKNSNTVGKNDSLWLEHEPDYDEIISEFQAFDKTDLTELVFCGYGEPLERAELLIEIACYVKIHTQMSIRINTNGLVNFINPQFDISAMKGVIDSVSISLNASTPDLYNTLVKPKFGLPSYNALLNFAIIIQEYVPEVSFTLVDYNLSEEEKEACAERARDIGIPLRIRKYIINNEDYN